MEFEFDKEMDFLLRQTAQSEAASAKENPQSAIRNPQSVHLDADELSAFAENALPEKARLATMLHLADCDRCRSNLAALIRLNVADSSEAIHFAEEKTLIAATLPWYRKLFAVPNLVYAMGALVLVFSGIVGYTLLQNAGNSRNAEVSQISEKQTGGKGMSSDGDQTVSESFSASNQSSSNVMSAAPAANMAMTNSAANSQANSAMSAASPAMNSNTAVLREADKDLPGAPKPSAPAKEAMPATRSDDLAGGSVPAPAPPPPTENEYSTDALSSQVQTQTNIQNQAELTPDSRNAKRSQIPAQRPELKNRKAESPRDDSDAAAEKSKIAATTSVGGKTFKRENNVWYDSAYRGQATTNVTRGTDEYKKLDANLRGIAENLGGTVVIVWKSKAYRIQ